MYDNARLALIWQTVTPSQQLNSYVFVRMLPAAPFTNMNVIYSRNGYMITCSRVWGEITFPFTNTNGSDVEV